MQGEMLRRRGRGSGQEDYEGERGRESEEWSGRDGCNVWVV
jgi:hypothetical protein